MEDSEPVIAWSEVEERAIPMFDHHHRERGLAWAKQAWAFLEAEEMTTRHNSFAEGLTYLRLIALALIHDGYNKAAWGTHKGHSAVEWAGNMPFSQFALGKMRGSVSEVIFGDTDEEQSAATIEYVARAHRWEVCKVLVHAYGSVDGLHASLWHIRYDPQDPKTPNAFSDEGSTKRALAFLDERLEYREEEQQ